MKKIRDIVVKNLSVALASFALFFSGVSLYGYCFYIFHQPKMPEELVKEGYIKPVPSKGFYVAEINRKIAREEQLNKIEELLEKAIWIAKEIDEPKKTLEEMIKILYEEEK